MTVTAILCGVFMACGIYLALADEIWRRLGGLALIGDALALLAISAGGDTLASQRIGVALVLSAFALFLVQACFIGARAPRPREAEDGESEERAQ